MEYHVQRNYTMKFGTFYYLTIVHIGKASGVFKFQIGVKWPGENKKKIPAVLLRLPPESKIGNTMCFFLNNLKVHVKREFYCLV